jgi:hypothetical protein
MRLIIEQGVGDTLIYLDAGGSVGQVALWDRLLSATEIRNLYRRLLCPSDPNPFPRIHLFKRSSR